MRASKALQNFKNGTFSGYRSSVNHAIADALNDRPTAFICLEAVLDILLETYVRMEREETVSARAEWRETFVDAYTIFSTKLNTKDSRFEGMTPFHYIVTYLCPNEDDVKSRAKMMAKANVAAKRYGRLLDEVIGEFDIGGTMRKYAV